MKDEGGKVTEKGRRINVGLGRIAFLSLRITFKKERENQSIYMINLKFQAQEIRFDVVRSKKRLQIIEQTLKFFKTCQLRFFTQEKYLSKQR